MVKFCVIGDPHGDLKKIRKVPKDVDFYLVTGDLGKADLARKICMTNRKRTMKGLPERENSDRDNRAIHDEIHYSTINVLKYLTKSAPVYSIQGNTGITTIVQARERTKFEGFKHIATRKIIDDSKNMFIVKNVIRNLSGIRIGFLEYFVDECQFKEFGIDDEKGLAKAMKESERIRRILKGFGKVDILICHQPPYGILDKINGDYGAPRIWWGKHAGSKVILDYVKKFQPGRVFCGHIHEGEGFAKIGKSNVWNLGVGGFEVVEL